MNRRVLLSLVTKSSLAGLAWHSSTAHVAFAAIQTASTPVVAPVASSTFEAQMQAYVAATETREYSEEGVPMIVVCEDLTAESPVSPVYSRAMNDAIAPLYQTYVETWSRLQPNARVVDVGKLLEMLSGRHFIDGGKDDLL